MLVQNDTLKFSLSPDFSLEKLYPEACCKPLLDIYDYFKTFASDRGDVTDF